MSVEDVHIRRPGTADELPEPTISSARVNLRALMDVVFGVAALALLLMWLVLAVAGGRMS
jgi:hypothetical protein